MASVLKVDELLKTDGSIFDARDAGIAGIGTVLQSQQVVYTGKTTDNSYNVWKDYPGAIGTGITMIPHSANSKFLVSWNLWIHRNTGQYTCYVRLNRGIGGSFNDLIAVGDTRGSRVRTTIAVRSASAEVIHAPYSGFYLDSPATTNQITYKMRFGNNFYGNTFTYNTHFNSNENDWDESGSGHTMISTLTVQEIAG